MNVGDRLFSLEHEVWGIAKVIVPEASEPVLFVQEDFEYTWWGKYTDFELEADYNTRIEACTEADRLAKEDAREKSRIDAHRTEMMRLLGQFVSGVNLRETLRTTLQTRYVCPICSQALLLPAGEALATSPMEAVPHASDCDWFRANELVKGFENFERKTS